MATVHRWVDYDPNPIDYGRCVIIPDPTVIDECCWWPRSCYGKVKKDLDSAAVSCYE